MKSQKGMTMVGLIVYVAGFLVITATIAGITTFFYSNNEVLDTAIGSNSQYSKFNLYFLNECKKSGSELYAWSVYTDSSRTTSSNTNRLSAAPSTSYAFLTFIDGSSNKNTFLYDYTQGLLYYNYIKLCDNVEDFQVTIDQSTGKTIMNVFINIDGTAFTTKYVIGS